MPLDVIGAGFLRTGTTSLKLALERLGYEPSYHMRVLNAEPARAADWLAAARDPGATDWDQIFDGFRSSVGSPGTAFWRQIVDANPEAKVVLTVRDPQSWYDSTASTIKHTPASPALVRLLTWGRAKSGDSLLEEAQQMLSEREGSQFTDREEALAAFQRHVDAVRAYVPPERLLIFNVREGWGPLCAFLGRPEPTEPFPVENDRASFRRRQRKAMNRVILRRAAIAAGIATTLALTVWARRGMRR
ncbi:sulfotransferase family protein [Micromonospora rubida]